MTNTAPASPTPPAAAPFTPPPRDWLKYPPTFADPYDYTTPERIRQYHADNAAHARAEIAAKLAEGIPAAAIDWRREQLEGHEGAIAWSDKTPEQIAAGLRRLNNMPKAGKLRKQIRRECAGAWHAKTGHEVQARDVRIWFDRDWQIIGPRALAEFPELARDVIELARVFAEDCPAGCLPELPRWVADYAARLIVGPEHPAGTFAAVRAAALDAYQAATAAPTTAAHEAAALKLRELAG